jgi:FlaA1/EpsC-like NDP-sugar epimerase
MGEVMVTGATGGIGWQLTRLFGISDPTAIRYCAELEQITAASAKPPAIA